jgi:hypothetical protein
MLRSTGCARAASQEMNYTTIRMSFHVNNLGLIPSGQLVNLGL